jgi:hypothetical protein
MSQHSSSTFLGMIMYIGYPIYINTSYCIYRITNMTYGSCGCGTSGRDFGKVRSFLTREEKVSMLKEYKDDLEREVQGVTERIKELENK